MFEKYILRNLHISAVQKAIQLINGYNGCKLAGISIQLLSALISPNKILKWNKHFIFVSTKKHLKKIHFIQCLLKIVLNWNIIISAVRIKSLESVTQSQIDISF